MSLSKKRCISTIFGAAKLVEKRPITRADAALGLCNSSLSNSLQNITNTVLIETKIENKNRKQKIRHFVLAFIDAKTINSEILRWYFADHVILMD